MRWLVVLVVLLAAAPSARADDVAVLAADVVAEHCADVASATDARSAEALTVVGDAWRQVSEAMEVSPRPYLLYWRGVLAQCLSQEDRAIADLQAFRAWYADGADDTARMYGQFDGDAARRLRQLGVRQPHKLGPTLVPALVATSAAGVLLVFSAQQSVALDGVRGTYLAPEEGKDFVALRAEGDELQRNALFWGIAGAAAATAGTVLFIATGVRGRPTATTSAIIVPTDGGLVVAIGGVW